MTLPQISIVTPCLNQGSFLEETIQSVLKQNYPNFEYIIIDGGSTDGSVEILKKYEKHITYWISEKDNGQTHAINKGLKRATGDILAYLNSDDIYLPGTLKTVANFFTEKPEYGIVYGDYQIINEQSKVIKKKRETPYDYTMGCCIGFGLIIPQPATFFTRKVINAIGYFNERFRFAMDADYWFRASQVTKIYHYPEFFAGFRIHGNSKTGAHLHKENDDYNKEIEEIMKRAYNTLKISKFVPYEYSVPIRKGYRIKRVMKKAIRKLVG